MHSNRVFLLTLGDHYAPKTMEQPQPLLAGLGAVPIAAAPAWFILIGHVVPLPRARRARVIALLMLYVSVNACTGVAWIFGFSAWFGQDSPSTFVFALLLLVVALPPVSLETRKRVRQHFELIGDKCIPMPTSTWRLERSAAQPP